MTNRALLLGALAAQQSTLHHPLRSRDSSIMVAALRALGATVDDSEESTWVVAGGHFTDARTAIAVGNAGTVLRFVPPVAALSTATVSFDGDAPARLRPVGPLLQALRELGASIDDGGRGLLPFTVTGTGTVHGGSIEIDASSSSQLVSALLLAGARYERGVAVRHVGERPVPNSSHLAMTAAMLHERGVEVTATPDHWAVAPGEIAAMDSTIEPDLSTAAPFCAAAVVTAGEVRILDWPKESTQPGAALPDLLAHFGASSRLDGDGMVIHGPASISGADLDLRDVGELTPVLAAIAAVAATPSRFTGIDYLRGHETDRLAALATELSALGADVREIDDGLEIIPKPLHGNLFATYDDHRMAMAGAVMGLLVPDLQIENVETTAKTMPGFADRWSAFVEGYGATP
jgi:3-phosphoshikimate 1-carboxyvinyltransferase